ncbi:hypothetical protein A4X13_0g5665 [Tilletia indica]|uniref:Uncharacterized protein n=1 Tax=Tilletia indica TaxID=43049 RepID=A0A177T7T3_9BASI|nr:hypothetical protein A4X13_0g5665 [Tilletia indica]
MNTTSSGNRIGAATSTNGSEATFPLFQVASMRTDAQLATAQLQIRNTTRPRSTSKRTGGNLGLWAAAAAKAAQGEVREKLAPYSSAPPRTGSTPFPALSDLMRPPIASQSTSSLPSSSARTSEPAQTTRVQPSIGPAVTSVPSATSPPILDHTRLHSVTERASTAETSKGALSPTTDNAAGIEEEQEETTEMADNEEAQQSEQELKEERAAEDAEDEENELFLPSDIARRLAALKHTRIRQSSLQAWQMESKGTSKSVPIRRSGSTMMLSSPSLPKDWKRSYKVLRLGLEKEEVVLEGKLASVKSRTADRDGVMEDISTVPANPSSQGSIPTKMNDAHTQSSPSREVQNGHEYEYARARGIEDVDEARHPLPASRSTRAVHSHRTHSITITDLVLRPSHFPFLISHEEYQQQAVHLRPQQLAPPLVSLKLVLAQLQRRPHRALVLQTPPPSVRPLLHFHLNTSRTLASGYAHPKSPTSTSPVDPSSSAKQAHPQKHSVSQHAPATSKPSNADFALTSSKKRSASTPSPNSNNAAHHGTTSSKSFPSPASATVFVEGGAWSHRPRSPVLSHSHLHSTAHNKALHTRTVYPSLKVKKSMAYADILNKYVASKYQGKDVFPEVWPRAEWRALTNEQLQNSYPDTDGSSTPVTLPCVTATSEGPSLTETGPSTLI